MLAAAALTAAFALAVGSATAVGAFVPTRSYWEVGDPVVSSALGPGLVQERSGGRFATCGASPVLALTAYVAYTGARVGETRTARLTGPSPGWSATVPASVAGRFRQVRGFLQDTFAIISFPDGRGQTTLPLGTYRYVLYLGGRSVLSQTITLVALAPCRAGG